MKLVFENDLSTVGALREIVDAVDNLDASEDSGITMRYARRDKRLVVSLVEVDIQPRPTNSKAPATDDV